MSEVKDAYWHINPDGWYPECSNCWYEPPWVKDTDMRTPYCPMCGSKMRKEHEVGVKQ